MLKARRCRPRHVEPIHANVVSLSADAVLMDHVTYPSLYNPLRGPSMHSLFILLSGILNPHDMSEELQFSFDDKLDDVLSSSYCFVWNYLLQLYVQHRSACSSTFRRLSSCLCLSVQDLYTLKIHVRSMCSLVLRQMFLLLQICQVPRIRLAVWP